jgi:hypothetical protein
MPFYGPEPFDTAEATYVWTGLGTPGFFRITVKGHARKFSSGFKIVRDPHWVGGLAFEVTGWTGPLAEPPSTTPYTVTDTFHGTFHKEIVVIGSNKSEVVKVKEVPFTSDEDVHKALSVA